MKQERIQDAYVITVVAEKPMRTLVGLAIEKGYSVANLTLWTQIRRIEDWLYTEYHICVWAVPRQDERFSPYYRDMRSPMSKSTIIKRPCGHREEAITEALTVAIGLIDKTIKY